MSEQKEMLEPLDFSDLSVREEIFPIGKKRFKLVEASGAAVKNYAARIAQGVTIKADGSYTGNCNLLIAAVELVSSCLFEEDEKLPGQFTRVVPPSVISGWPNRVQEGLIRRCKLFSGLEVEETRESLVKTIAELQKKLQNLDQREAELKKPQSDTADGSGLPDISA